jgi:5'-methylthioadenosine phosphorylase
MSDLRVGLIGGTGLGEALGATAGAADGGGEVRRHEIDTPFGRPSDAILETTWAGVPVLLLGRHGPGHLLNPSQVPFRANIYALKQLGCTHILASGAVGSLREEYKPRDLVIADQVIDRTTRRAGTFFDNAAVHVEFAEPFCPVLRQMLLEAAKAGGEAAPATVHDRGCYVAMEGPAFSSRAESLMHRLWGGDLIGMTAMPEAKLAREAEIPYALVALVTDYDSWRRRPPMTAPAAGGTAAAQQPAAEPVDPHLLLREILANVQAATTSAVELMKRTVELMGQRREQLSTCPAMRALELAIWSDKARIAPEEVRRLAPLWGKYFEPPPSQQ